MILQNDSLLSLNYDATTDILEVIWPDLLDTPFSEIENSLHKLSASVAHFDIKKLLLDLSTSVLSLNETLYKELVIRFMADLGQTRLLKMARISATDAYRENQLHHYSLEIKSKVTLPFQVKSFPDKPQALAWLKSA